MFSVLACSLGLFIALLRGAGKGLTGSRRV